jgi:ribonucleoside-triphosphate reductase
MFGNFYFPDGSKPDWESLEWMQQEFMQWFNDERTRCLLTFPVESFALVYKDGKFLDENSAKFVAEEYARGHSFFTYISDTVDSLSSCCRLKNKLQTKEFNFTNGNIGVQTGSKSVITLNLNRIIQDWFNTRKEKDSNFIFDKTDKHYDSLNKYVNKVLDRVYKYHTAYNELLWDMYNANLLPVYKAGFIDLNKQYLTIGLNGLNQAAEFLGLVCRDNEDYSKFCQTIFGNIKEQNLLHKVTDGKHKLTFNTECVPAESLAIKNYNWDKQDGYYVPENRNLYASYIYLPSDERVNILEKIRMHGKNYIGDYLDGGSAAHLNLDSHLSKEQYNTILKYAAEQGCQYLTFNVPNSECQDCGFITKTPICKCPKCNSEKISYYDRIIGYLTKIDNWSDGRKIEQKSRIYEKY